MNKLIICLIILGSVGCRILHKEKHLLEVETKQFSLHVIDDIKSKKSIEIKFIPKCDMRIPLHYLSQKNYQYFYVKNGICTDVNLGWDMGSLDRVLNTKLIEKGSQISQNIELNNIKSIKFFRLNISFISNPDCIYNNQIEQTGLTFWTLMDYYVFYIYIKS